MADKIHFQITTADGVVCDAMASYALIPLTDGDVGVLADHAPMIGALNEGVVKYVCIRDRPIVMHILSLLFCFIQAMVFTMLLAVFINEATEDEE